MFMIFYLRHIQAQIEKVRSSTIDVCFSKTVDFSVFIK